MRLAVFTNIYPAYVATFFERDMRALREAGVDLDIFVIHPLEPELWRYSSELLHAGGLPRERVHHLDVKECVRPALASLRRGAGTLLRDATAVLLASVPYGPLPLAKTAYVLPKAWAWAARHAGRYDHVLAYWGNYAGTCAYAFHRLQPRPVPFTIWLHAGTDLYRTPVFLRQKLAYADNVITCCEFNREYIREHFAADQPSIVRKVHVCHHGLDLAEFPYRPDGRPAGRILAVGRLARNKGFDYLFVATQILRARGIDVTVDLIGDGDQRAVLTAFAGDLGIADRVRFRGWLPFPDVRRAMGEATMLVHPSDGLGDGLPNVVREAMALGTPVVASRVAGIPDALSDGCGVLVPPRDPAALADAIESVLGDPAVRLDIATRARRRVEERYDLWRNGALLAGLLRETRRRPRCTTHEAWTTGRVREESA